MFSFTLIGEVPSKKNAWKRGKNGNVYIAGDVSDKLSDLMVQLRAHKNACGITFPLRGQMQVDIAIHEPKTTCDLDNQITSIFDLLQKTGVIYNDKEIVDIRAARVFSKEWKVEIALGAALKLEGMKQSL